MSVPIKAQLFGVGMTDGNGGEWDGILILCDGKAFENPKYPYSYYGLMDDGMHALSRSYCGQVIKESLKSYSAQYHDLRFQANNVMRESGDIELAEEIRDDAQVIKEVCIEPLLKFWIRFKSLRPVKPIKPDTRNTVKNVECTANDLFGDYFDYPNTTNKLCGKKRTTFNDLPPLPDAEESKKQKFDLRQHKKR